MLSCPECGTRYRRRDFDRSDTYFECDSCSVELVDDGRPEDDDGLLGVSSYAERVDAGAFVYNTLGATPESARHVARTPASISQTYGFGIVVHRWIARVIDNVILMVPSFAMAYLLDGGALIGWLLLLILQFVYFSALDGNTGGTPGKRICGLRVVDEDGGVPGLEKGVIRTATCLIEMNPILFGALPALLLALLTRTHQRLGDLFAKTYVLKVEDVPLVSE